MGQIGSSSTRGDDELLACHNEFSVSLEIIQLKRDGLSCGSDKVGNFLM